MTEITSAMDKAALGAAAATRLVCDPTKAKLCKNSSHLQGLPPLDSCRLQVSYGTFEKIWMCSWQVMKEEEFQQAWVIFNSCHGKAS